MPTSKRKHAQEGLDPHCGGCFESDALGDSGHERPRRDMLTHKPRGMRPIANAETHR